MSSNHVAESVVESNADTEEDETMKTFRYAAMQTVDKSVHIFRRSIISLCSGCSPARREKLEVVCGQLTEQLSNNVRSEIQQLTAEHQLAEKLRHLSLLKQEQIKWQGQRAWRPSGEPSVDMEDHLYPLMKEHKELLEAGLRKLKGGNRELEAEVLAGRLRLETRNKDIKRITRRLEELAKNFANEVERTISNDTSELEATRKC